jgi:rhodanese-related sulfurtransferase
MQARAISLVDFLIPYESLSDPSASPIMFQNIDAAALQNLLAQQAVVLIDVRTDAEVARGVIAGARHIALFSLPGRVAELSDAGTVVIYCQSGGRSAQACSYLAQQGFRDLYNLSGGIMGWLRAGNSLSDLM